MKLKIYKTIFALLVLLLIFVSVLIIFKYIKNYKNETESKEVVSMFYDTFNTNNQETKSISNVQENNEPQKEVSINGYKVIGIIKIPKIGIEYPILNVEAYNPADTKEPMEYGIVKYWGGNVNEYGNLSIAGHNYYNGTMFGKTRKLEIGDTLELTDTDKKTIQYKIYNKFITDPKDVTILENNNKEVREVTLITCTNGNRNRLILKARENN